MKRLPINLPDQALTSVDRRVTSYRPPLPEESGPPYDHARLYFSILRRRKWCIIVPSLIVFFCVAIFLLFEEPQYSANARILIENAQPQILDISSVSGHIENKNFYATEYKMIANEENLIEVIDRLDLYREDTQSKIGMIKKLRDLKENLSTAYASLKQHILPTGDDLTSGAELVPEVDPEALRRHHAITAFRKALTIQPLDGEKLVDITITGLEPQTVARQANTLVEVYARKNIEKKSATTRNAIEWLQRQTADLRAKTYKAELELQTFQEKVKLITLDADDRVNTTLANLAHLHRLNSTAQAERINVENRYKSLVKLSGRNIEDLTTIPTYIDENLIASIMFLRKQYLETQLEYANKSKVIRDKHPVMLNLKAQADQIEKQIRAEMQQAVNALQAELNMRELQEKTFLAELTQQESKSFKINRNMTTYNALKRDVESYRKLFQQASQRLRELQMSDATVANNVQLVKAATMPIKPVLSRTSLQLVLALLVGGCMGVGIAILRESFDLRFKDVHEIEPLMQIAFLGIIPHHMTLNHGSKEVVSMHDPGSLVAEAYLTLRTRILSIAPAVQSLLVTSAVPAEGKSSTSANLGVVFAQMGRRVLLVDTDLRRPSLHRHFNIVNGTGLADIMAVNGDWRSVLQRTDLENLYLLTAGVNRHNAPGLLSQLAMFNFPAEFNRDFDLVIFDAPVVLGISDVEIVAPHVDAVLMVHSPDLCQKASVMQTKNILERARVTILGLVLNNVRQRDQLYYSQPYYSY